MRKFKLNTNFQPLPSEVGDKFFRTGIFEFNTTKLLAFTKANKDKFQVEELATKDLRVFPSHNLNQATIKNANLLNPIILAEISPRQFNVIDGRHRLEKAYRNGMKKILSYRIFAEQHILFLTSTRAYKTFVEYWNSKLKTEEETNAIRKISLS